MLIRAVRRQMFASIATNRVIRWRMPAWHDAGNVGFGDAYRGHA